MNRVEVQRLIGIMNKISANKVDEGMVGARLSTRAMEASSEKDYDEMMRLPARVIRR